MKSNELMIGDWLYDKDNNQRIISAIRTGEVEFLDGGIPQAIGSVNPIPLTAEILEKNEFVNDSSYDECVADGCFVTVQIWSYSIENVLIQWDGITCEVINDLGYPCEKITLHGINYEHDIYVHELLHALRLCGLNELADNFKL